MRWIVAAEIPSQPENWIGEPGSAACAESPGDDEQHERHHQGGNRAILQRLALVVELPDRAGTRSTSLPTIAPSP